LSLNACLEYGIMEYWNVGMLVFKRISSSFDELVKSYKIPFSVIPAKAGIQSFQELAEYLDSGFHRSDDFLRVHQF
jgi:hypothetical protein